MRRKPDGVEIRAKGIAIPEALGGAYFHHSRHEKAEVVIDHARGAENDQRENTE
jgi:hypothetical protein